MSLMFDRVLASGTKRRQCVSVSTNVMPCLHAPNPYLCAYVSVCICVHAHKMHSYASIPCVCVCVCMCTRVHHVCGCARVHSCACMHAFMLVCLSTRLCLCMHTCVVCRAVGLGRPIGAVTNSADVGRRHGRSGQIWPPVVWTGSKHNCFFSI